MTIYNNNSPFGDEIEYVQILSEENIIDETKEV